MTEDERTVDNLLRWCGMNVTQIAPGEKRTPDFRVEQGDDLFYCEVKSAEKRTTNGGIQHSTIANAMTAQLHNAVKQFDAVNPARTAPNVLAWVTHSHQFSVHTFVDLYRGAVTVADTPIASLAKQRFGAIRPRHSQGRPPFCGCTGSGCPGRF